MNIMVYGVPDDEWEHLKERIDAAVQFAIKHGIEGSQQALTTRVPSMVESCDGKRTRFSYIDICGTEEEQARGLAMVFQSQGIHMRWITDHIIHMNPEI